MVTIGGEHVQAGTGKLVTYKVDLDHGPEFTYYAARVLLLGATWHELEGGTITGRDQNARTPQVMQAVFAKSIAWTSTRSIAADVALSARVWRAQDGKIASSINRGSRHQA